MAVLTLAQDDFRARRPRIGTCSLTPGDAEAVASPRLKPGPRPGQACGRIGGERSLVCETGGAGLLSRFVASMTAALWLLWLDFDR